MVTVLFFAGLRESVGTACESLPLPDGVTNVAALRDHLVARGGSWTSLTTSKNLRVAVNQDMVKIDAKIKDGDEIAFFPPVTGG